MSRLVTISFTGLDAGGGVPKFNRDLHAAFPDRECIHFCSNDLPSNMHRRWEWEQARALNLYLIDSKKLCRDDVIIADGFWAAGLHAFKNAISHSHGIWSHLTYEDVLNGKAPENPLHHTAQVDFRRRWLARGKSLTAVSGFIARQMFLQWGFQTSRVIENGVDTNVWKPLEKKLKKRNRLIIHGVNDKGNLNKGWDHIQAIIDEFALDDVMSLDEYAEFQGIDKPTALANADLVVHPSGYEGNSMFIAEALASGVPVIGYDVGYMYSLVYSLPTVIDRTRRSPEFTLAAVRDCLVNKPLMRSAADVGREIAVNELSIEKFRNRWRVFVEEIENA